VLLRCTGPEKNVTAVTWRMRGLEKICTRGYKSSNSFHSLVEQVDINRVAKPVRAEWGIMVDVGIDRLYESVV
jgi:hypothetical protein